MKTKLLYLVHRIPYPPNKGDKIRSFHFLQTLAAEFEIFLGTFIDDPEDNQYIPLLKPFCADSLCINLDAKTQKLISLKGFLYGEALSLPYYRNRQLQDWVDKTIRDQNIQRVLIFSSPMAQYVENYPSLHLVADLVDVDSDKWRQYALNKRWPLNWIYRREAEKLLTYEKHIAATAKFTLLVSEQEAKLLKTLVPQYADKIDFVNNGVDIERFDPDLDFDNPFTTEEQTLVFTGAMDYWANVDAVKWFAEQVLPIIKQQLAGVHFYIVGSKAAKEVLELAENDDAVIVTGRVEDVRPYVAHAGVVVAPLRIARGIQNKVLEGLAMAKPVVVTSAAMEGITVTGSLQIAVADSAEDFAARVLQYLLSPTQLAEANREFVKTEFSWRQNGQKLCQLLDKSGEN